MAKKSDKEYTLIRINMETKILFDSIALKCSKKTDGLFEEMCHYYNDNHLNKNSSQNTPLSLPEGILLLRKNAIAFLNNIERMNTLLETSLHASKESAPNQLEDKKQIKEAFHEVLHFMKNSSMNTNSYHLDKTPLEKLQHLIEKI